MFARACVRARIQKDGPRCAGQNREDTHLNCRSTKHLGPIEPAHVETRKKNFSLAPEVRSAS
jgi:hypothetical protein